MQVKAQSYLHLKLVFQPRQVEVEIGTFHWSLRPASDLGDDSGGHIGDEAVLPVQQVQEGTPDRFLCPVRKVVEDFDTGTVLL